MKVFKGVGTTAVFHPYYTVILIVITASEEKKWSDGDDGSSKARSEVCCLWRNPAKQAADLADLAFVRQRP